MTRFRGLKALAVAAGGFLAVLACGPTQGEQGKELAPADQQILRFTMVNDIGDFDPAKISAAADANVMQNVFSGLYKFDHDTKVVPDIADGQPDVSSDGTSVTIKMKKTAKFSDGTPVKAKDFVYSWNRTAATQGDYASTFDAIEGYDEVADGKTKTMTGLSAPDDYTLKAKLAHPAGYFVSELALWATWVTEQKVVEAAPGGDLEAGRPQDLVGTGPFKLVSRTPKASLAFEPVANWWNGSTGALKKVTIDVIEDQGSQTKKYEQGGLDVVGYGDDAPTAEDILRYKAGTHSKELLIKEQGRTDWIGFNFETGPFKGLDAGKDGRKAFSLAVDRNQLVDVACSKATACKPATGGVVSKGLKAYLGDGADSNTKFDASTAKSLYQKWDPDGSKVKGLKYTYNTANLNKLVAENLQSQWRSNLGVNIDLEATDRQSFFKSRTKKTYPIFRHSWGADYDNPQDWFDFLFKTGAGSSGSGFSDPKFDDQIKKANAKKLDDAISDYQAAGKILVSDVAYGGLFYGTHRFLIKPYMDGIGTSALYDYPWIEAKVLKH